MRSPRQILSIFWDILDMALKSLTGWLIEEKYANSLKKVLMIHPRQLG